MNKNKIGFCDKRSDGWLMKKPFLKKASVCATAILALGICIAGYYVSKQRQHQQRVAYASAIRSNEKVELDDLAQQVEELYLNEDQDLLKEELTMTEVTSLQTEVNRIKVSAEDFQIDKSSLPKGMKDLAKEKETVVNHLTDISDKLRMQEYMDSLFVEEIPNWQEFKDTVAVKDNLQKEEVEDVAENLSFFAEDKWLKLAKEYNTTAGKQLRSIEDIQKELVKYEKEEISYEQYTELSAQIKQVRNQKQHDKFEKAADKLGERFNVSSAGAAEENSADESSGEGTVTYEQQSVPIEQENTEAYSLTASL